MYEYKVIAQRDARFAGTFDTDALEQALNEHAADGWRLVEGFLAASVWKSAKAEMVFVLERAGAV